MNLKAKLTHSTITALIALLGFGLMCLTGMAQWATNDFIVNAFDTPDETNAWVRAWGAATGDISYDESNDAQNLTNSGSLKLAANFDASFNAGDNQFAFVGKFQLDPGVIVDASLYTNVEFDLLWDTTNSPSNGGTNFGSLTVLLNSTVGVYIVPTNSGWQHVVLPINPTLPQIARVNSILFQMWAPSFTGTATFWLDNIKLVAPTNAMARPRPVLSLKAATPGLQLVSTTFDGPGARNGLLTTYPDHSWINAPTPTTYSVTIKAYPNFATYPHYQTYIFLIPQSSLSYYWDNFPDWTATNLIFVSIQSETNGSGVGLFMFKTNALGGGWQNQIWGSNVLAGLWSSNVLGTWSLSFNNNTNVTLTAPGNSSTNFILPPEAIPWFADTNGLYAYLGSQPNRDVNAGQSSIFAEVKITGGVDGEANPSQDIDETFTNIFLDSSVWRESGFRYLPVATADTPLWVQWTLPASGSYFMASKTLAPGDWYDASYSIYPVQPGSVVQALIQNSVFGTNRSFFLLTR